MVIVKMTLTVEDYNRFLKSCKMIENKKTYNKKKVDINIPEFLRNKTDYPCNYTCGLCKSNLYLRGPSNYYQHINTKKHKKNINKYNDN